MERNTVKKLLVYVVIVCLSVYLYRYQLFDFINKHIYKEYVLHELTIEEKLEDFEAFHTTIVESVPFLEDIQALYDIDFTGRKEYYRSEIRDTKNNFEFYCVMKAISKDISSFHTDVCFPFYENLVGLSCYDSKEILTYPGTKAQVDAWFSLIGEYVMRYSEMGMEVVKASYVDGTYVVTGGSSSNSHRELENCELVKVNDVPIDQYITDRISTYALRYDSFNSKPYRDACIFNDSIGDLVDTVWRNQSGEEFVVSLFADCGAEAAFSFDYVYTGIGGPEWIPSIEMHRDDENQLEYIAVNDFLNVQGEELKRYIKDTVYDKIVIDLRNNYGGQSKYGQKYLYPFLHNEKVTFSFEWKVPDTESNEAMTKNLIPWWNYYQSRDESFYYYKDNIKYQGKCAEDKDVYYLVGERTGSAADTYISMIKENSLGTIVGTNSGGEGLGASFVCKKLDNSSLIYVYYPSRSIDREVDYNPCLGTQPDVYINQSYEDFILEQQYRKEGIAEQYDKRIQYDTAMKWVIEQ